LLVDKFMNNQRRRRTPRRFAEFVEGSFHIAEEETNEFETSLYGRGFRLPQDDEIFTDDESD